MKYITEGFDFNDALQSDINTISDTQSNKISKESIQQQTNYALQWIKNNAVFIRNKDNINLEFAEVDNNSYINLFNLDVNSKYQKNYIKFDLAKDKMPFGFNNINGDVISLTYLNIGNNINILPYNIINNIKGNLYISNMNLTIYDCTVPNLFQGINHEINYDNGNISIHNSNINTLKGLTSCNTLELSDCDNITTLDDYIPEITKTLIIEDCKNFTLTNKIINTVPDIQITNLENLNKETCKVLNQHNTTTQYYKSEFNDPTIIDITKLIKGFRESDNYKDNLQNMFENVEFVNCDGEVVVFNLAEDMETIDTEIQFQATCKSDAYYNGSDSVGSVEFENFQIIIDNKDILENMSDNKKNDIFFDLIDDMTDAVYNGIIKEGEENWTDDDGDYDEWDR